MRIGPGENQLMTPGRGLRRAAYIAGILAAGCFGSIFLVAYLADQAHPNRPESAAYASMMPMFALAALTLLLGAGGVVLSVLALVRTGPTGALLVAFLLSATPPAIILFWLAGVWK